MPASANVVRLLPEAGALGLKRDLTTREPQDAKIVGGEFSLISPDCEQHTNSCELTSASNDGEEQEMAQQCNPQFVVKQILN